MNERLNEKIYPAHSLIEVNVNETFGQTDRQTTYRHTDRQRNRIFPIYPPNTLSSGCIKK